MYINSCFNVNNSSKMKTALYVVRNEIKYARKGIKQFRDSYIKKLILMHYTIKS